jgi:hypothetical protein
VTDFNPEKWEETAVRGVKDYVEANIDTDLYAVVMEFPGALLDAQEMPLDKTVIHFDIDDHVNQPLGLGEKPIVDNYDDTSHTVNPQWGAMHRLNFDVGIWASDKSGGTTSRMRANQYLMQLFGFPNSVDALRAATDGGDGAVEILRYSGGNNTIDTVNDVRVYRMIGGELEVRVFSRTPLSDTPSPAIEEIVQSPGLTIIG